MMRIKKTACLKLTLMTIFVTFLVINIRDGDADVDGQGGRNGIFDNMSSQLDWQVNTIICRFGVNEYLNINIF